MFVCAAPAAAQDAAQEPDEEGCVDSKLITRMKGCRILSCGTKDFDAYDMVVGKYDTATGEWPTKALEGKIDTLDYVCPATVSSLQIARNMENALKAAGFKMVTVARLDDQHYITVNKGSQWLEIEVGQWNSQFHYEQTAVLVQARRGRGRERHGGGDQRIRLGRALRHQLRHGQGDIPARFGAGPWRDRQAAERES
jgi:hypothetical protein